MSTQLFMEFNLTSRGLNLRIVRIKRKFYNYDQK